MVLMFDHTVKRRAMLGAALVMALFMTACGGTKVYDVSKTLVYRDNIYNLTDVRQLSRKTEGKLADGEMVNLSGVDKRQFEQYLEASPQIFVRMYFQFDEDEMVYRADNVDNWRDFQRMADKFEDAGDDVAGLLKENKTKQLKLR